jgi:hypothetical protein
MAAARTGVLASFAHVDAATDAIRALRARGHEDLTVYSAAPNHEIEEALDQPVSPVRLFTLFGGLIGCAAGFGMQYWMQRDWPVLVGGKSIDAFPPMVIIGFELTILLGALASVAGVIILSMVLKPSKGLPFDPKFTDDRIGIFVPCTPDQYATAGGLLRDAGAEEVRHA